MDEERFRERVESLLDDAAGEVEEDAVAGLLTAYLARLRGDVRLPLGMGPDRARAFRGRLDDHVGGTVEVELLVTDEVLAALDLQLSAVEGGATRRSETSGRP